MEATKQKINWLAITLLVVVAILAFSLFEQCETAARQQTAANVNQYEIKLLKNKNNTLTASVETYQLTEKDWKNSDAKKDKELMQLTNRFSKLSSITTVTAKATIDSVAVVFDKPIAPVENGFQRSGDLSKDWLTANYKVNEKGFQLSDVQGTIAVTTITGFKKSWFWGKQSAMTDVTPALPNVTIVQVKATQIVEPVKFYESKLFLIGTGFLIRSFIPNPKL